MRQQIHPLGGCQRLRGVIVWYYQQRSHPWCVAASEHRPAAAWRSGHDSKD